MRVLALPDLVDKCGNGTLSNFVIVEPIRVVNLGAVEWKVISKLCGKEWVEDHDGYWPADTPKPGT